MTHHHLLNRLGRRSLAPVGGVATVASLWMGERSVATTSSRITHKAGEALMVRKYCSTTTTTTSSSAVVPRGYYPVHPFRQFSSQVPKSSGATTATSTTTAANSTAAEAATASTASASGKKGSMSFMEWYEGHLQTRPVITKMFTGCFLWGLGDAVAQVVPQIAYSDTSPTIPNDTTKNDNNTTTTNTNPPFQYDLVRTGRAVLYGFVLHAPASHVHFNFLEWLTHRVGITQGWGIPVFKTVMEQFVYWGWISNALYLAAMGGMQGHSYTKVYDKIHDSLWDLMIAQWAFWIPVQLLNFQFIPVRHQLNVVLITSIVWTALLSFWYPPEVEDTAVEEKVEDKKETTTKPVEAPPIQ